jgi:hypothetical protein
MSKIERLNQLIERCEGKTFLESLDEARKAMEKEEEIINSY